MSAGKDYILKSYTTEYVLQDSSYSRTELVLQNGTPYIRKIINGTGLPYLQLKNQVHPGLPYIFYAVEAEGKTYVIEEYLSGTTLKELLQQGTYISGPQQEQLAKQLCQALCFLHAKGILHRDIKPSNIIVMHDLQQVKLIDFGISRYFSGNAESCEQDTCIMGTPGYAPPEQYGFSTTDQRSDIYALGKSLLELKNEATSPKLLKILERCTAFDPDKRYQKAEALLVALDKKDKAPTKLLACGLLALLVLTTGYYCIKEHLAPPPESAPNKSAATNPAPKATSLPTSDNRKTPALQKENSTPPSEANAVYSSKLVKLRQVDLDWWFDKASLQTIDAQEKLFCFHGENHQGPSITIENPSDYPAINPVLKLDLYSFGMEAENFQVQTDASHTEKITFSRKDRRGIARRVTLQLKGTIPPKTTYTFIGLQRVQKFYMYYKGNSGTILGNLEAPNMLTQAVGYRFTLR